MWAELLISPNKDFLILLKLFLKVVLFIGLVEREGE